MKKVYDKRENCTGCEACVNVCPQKAISMKQKLNGFAYPEINRSKCADCGACRDVCQIYLTPDGVEAKAFYAAKAKEELRFNSSSGGVFPVLAQHILEQGGAVCAAAMDDDMVVRHRVIYKAEEVQRLTKTKYVQSRIGNCFKEIKKRLIENPETKVLFVGTPCQCEGLKLFLKKGYPNLINASLICYGVPSPGSWAKYVKKTEKKYGGKMSAFDFRDKRAHDSGHTVSFSIDGKEQAYSMYKDEYCLKYFRNEIIRENCFNCKFCTPDRHFDLTLGDFWGIEKTAPEMDDKMGVSLVICHTVKGEEMFGDIKETLVECRKVEREEALQPRLIEATKKNA